MNYYNDSDPFICEWVRLLIMTGEVPDGVVDERPIQEITPNDLKEFTQCHFFCGILGWPLALQLAGWPPERKVFTGSCPCQPFSVAGKQKGTKDDRHLWPVWFNLIKKCKPDFVIGEQVEGAIKHGWLDGIQTDLEKEGYAVGHCILGAHSVGAPHIRRRLYWLADAQRDAGEQGRFANQSEESNGETAARSHSKLGRCGDSGRLGDSNNKGSQGRSERPYQHADQLSPWASGEFIQCADGKARRVEPGIFPLVDGFPNRMGVLRGSGNAIVPQVAAAFISAFMAAEGDA